MKTATKVILLALLSLIILVWGEIAKRNLPGRADFSLYMFDVGQGDSILLQKENQQILIDGGPDNSILEGLRKTMPVYDQTIELLILTHPDFDHLRGFLEVLRYYKIKEIWSNGVDSDSLTYRDWQNLINEKQIRIKVVKQGNYYGCDQSISICLKVLWPDDHYQDQSVELNDTSLVLKLEYGEFSALLTGDAENKALNGILENGDLVKAKVLKLSHHGATNGSPKIFLEAVKPELALISVGANNKYGHPHQVVIDRLKELEIKNYRTDQSGMITIFSDGTQYWTKLER